MKTTDIIVSLGLLTAICFSLAFSNFLVKFIYKKYISQLGKENKQIVDLYRSIMKMIVKNHKLIGLAAVLSVVTHFLSAFIFLYISLTGIIAASLLIIVFFLGVYGAFINRNYKGWWLKVHRVLAFALIIAIGVHLFTLP